ncbi:MAG: MliC family protein [Caulobacteraceae bacterium]|nr:MliC family protein [Caulobacteraceae bacterium]
MRRFQISIALIAAAAGLAACTPRWLATPETPPTVVAIYRCDDGQTLKATFDNGRGRVRMILGDGSVTTLEGQPVGSGIHYANDWYDLRGKGAEATFAVKDRRSTHCLAEG